MKYVPLLLTFGILACGTTTGFSQLPIKPTRTVSFTTDEGTNMDVDISADGRTLLFDLLGDLYTLPVAGGTATQLTKGMAINYHPVWSPDGQRIAYLSDFSGALHLNVINRAGCQHVVMGKADEQINSLANHCLLWSPGSEYVAIDSNLYGLAGGKVNSHFAIKDPIRFSADGNLLYYLDSGRLCYYDHNTGYKAKIYPLLPQVAYGILSPDAHWWVYSADSNSKKCLVALDLVHNRARILVTSLFLKYPFYKLNGLNIHYSFSTDSKSLFIGYGGKLHRIDVESGRDEVIPFIAHVNVDAATLDYNTFPVEQGTSKVKYTRSANESPDGKHLVFSALDRLYMMDDLANGRPRRLADQPMGQFQPIYSPDGKWIAYVSWCDTAGGYLWRIPANGGRPERLTEARGQYQRPAWSPDGTLIAVVRAEAMLGPQDGPLEGQLELVPVNGGPAKVIDDSVPLWNQISFSRTGSRIIYEPKAKPFMRSPGPLLVSKDLNGADLRVLAVGRETGLSTFIQQRTASPDGRFIVYSMGEDLYLVPRCGFTLSTVLFDEGRLGAAIRFAQGVDPNWDSAGKVLSYSYGNKFYRIGVDKIVNAARKRKVSGIGDSDFITVRVPPDQVVDINFCFPVFHACGTIVLRDVRIITMNRDQVIEHGTIVITNGRFSAIGLLANVRIPTGAKVLDLPGTTVMPGLVDMHLHMLLPPDVMPQQSWVFLANLAYGVTTARDPSFSFDSFGYKELLESGQMIGPRLYTVGRPVILGFVGIMRIDALVEARRIVQKRAALGATYIKQYLLPKRLQRQWLLMASREAGLNMTNERLLDLVSFLGMMKDGSTGVEHNPEWGDTYKDVTTLISKLGTYFTPTLQVGYGDALTRTNANYLYWHQPDAKLMRFMPKDYVQGIINAQAVDTVNSGFMYPAIIDAEVRKKGGRVLLGSHGNDKAVGVHNELWALQMGGLSNMEALQAATIMGAEGLGIQKDVGSIAVGKIADLLVLSKNPLDDIHNSREIRYVMKGGILYDGDTLDMLWPTFKKCPEWRIKGPNDH